METEGRGERERCLEVVFLQYNASCLLPLMRYFLLCLMSYVSCCTPIWLFSSTVRFMAVSQERHYSASVFQFGGQEQMYQINSPQVQIVENTSPSGNASRRVLNN